MKALVPSVLRTATRFGGLFAAAAWILLALAAAALQRGEGSDDSVIGSLGGFALPLVSFTFASAALYGGNLRSAVSPFIRLGASPLDALATVFAVPVCASALAGALLGASVVAITRTSSSPPLDMLMTSGIAALAGAAYAAIFVAASSLGKNGGGRGVVLALDFLFGASSGLAGALSVRGHVQNLLGGEAPLELSPRTSSIVLALMVVASLGVARLRLRPPRARLKRATAIDRARGA